MFDVLCSPKQRSAEFIYI